MTTLLILGIGFLGATAHWLMKFARNQTDLNLRLYLTTNKAATLRAFIGVFGAVFAITAATPIDISVMKDVSTIFMAGYLADSWLNSTEEK